MDLETVVFEGFLGWMEISPTATCATGALADEQFYETPHLDQLSRDGISFARCYSGLLCSPSRATIVTGRNGVTFGFNNAAGMRGGKWSFATSGMTPRFPLATAIGNFALPNDPPDGKGLRMYSLGEMLRDYRSTFLGKWHIGGGDVAGHRPQDFGFEAITYEDEG